MNIQKIEIELTEKYRDIEKQLTEKYGIKYPKNTDTEGWQLIGRKQGLAVAIEKIKDIQIKKTNLYNYMRCPLKDEPIEIPEGSICIEYVTINNAPEINKDGSQKEHVVECIQWLEPINV